MDKGYNAQPANRLMPGLLLANKDKIYLSDNIWIDATVIADQPTLKTPLEAPPIKKKTGRRHLTDRRRVIFSPFIRRLGE